MVGMWDVEDIDLCGNVHELRRTPTGRAQLRAMGRSGPHVNDMQDRPFVAWDGEGITYHEGQPQAYVLFGASTGHHLQGPTLFTSECLRLMLECARDHPDSLHVGFGIGYDVEQICRNLSSDEMTKLLKSEWTRHNHYRLHYVPRKWFHVIGELDGIKYSCKIWDLYSFFTTSFLKAVQKYLGNLPELDRIETGKQARDAFQYDELETLIKPYWQTELDLLVRLADKLRELLITAGIHLSWWHGPGAVASYLFKANDIREYMNAEQRAEIQAGAQYAFAGGRFEQYALLQINAPVYEYDLNSAYPAAIVDLPPLTGRWHRTTDIEPFGVYLIEYNNPDVHLLAPHPLFHRAKSKHISYPPRVMGWYWTPEAQIAINTGCARILDGWALTVSNTRPFAWVWDMYEQRQEWKRNGVQAEYALKLGLNSLYGKMAQRAGWTETNQQIPRWHQLEWAGYITSTCRAQLWDAIQQAWLEDSLIAVETDAVFTTEPLDLDEGRELGQWDRTRFDDLIYLQPGLKWSRVGDLWTLKYRGLDPDSITIERTLEYVRAVDMRLPEPLVGTVRRFNGWNLSKNTKHIWRSWTTEERKIALGATGKRRHDPNNCRGCDGTQHYHDLIVDVPRSYYSHPHQIPWKDNPCPLQRLSAPVDYPADANGSTNTAYPLLAMR